MPSTPPGRLAHDLAEAGRPPADLAAAVAWTLLTLLSVYLPVVNETPLRVVFGLPLVLFIPGYVLIAALFPRNDDLDWLERVALSFGLSIAVVPLIGLVLNYTPWGIRLDPVLAALSLFVIAMAAAATARRLGLPAEDRLTVPVGRAPGLGPVRALRAGPVPARPQPLDPPRRLDRRGDRHDCVRDRRAEGGRALLRVLRPRRERQGRGLPDRRSPRTRPSG